MTGRLTIPTDIDVVKETLETMKRLGADALRDCDGTEFPIELKDSGAKIYSTYYTTRKDNVWARANPDEVQQMYIMTRFCTANEDELIIPLLKGISMDLLSVNERDDVARWWEVIDRTSNQILPKSQWEYDKETVSVVVKQVIPYHEYTVSFLADIIWDPVHMYNAVTNSWEGVENQITFDVRQPKTKEYSMKRLRTFIEENPHVDVIRFTTFFHQFTLIFDELKRQKYVDWYGYSASVSPYILEQFEKEVGYTFRAEYIIDQGYYNNQYRIPSKEYKDFMAFQRREVASLAKEMVDICHEYGKEAMMFLGDHFIGADPWAEEFAGIGLDAVVGSVGNAATLRLISDIKGVSYTEGRFLPYFFPDTFHPQGNPVAEAKANWLSARRGILRSPIDRIGYGGYLKLALDFPEFVDYIEQVCNEFRTLYGNLKQALPFTVAKVAVLNCWGQLRAWGNHMVHHALYQKQNYSYFGAIEAMAGGPYDVCFISFDDIRENPNILEDIDVILNIGGADTAHSGGEYWAMEDVISPIRKFIGTGGGFIGIGEPSAHIYNGRIFQLANALGVEKENGFTLGYNKYNWEEHSHFITDGLNSPIDFGEGTKNIYALEGTKVLIAEDEEVQLAVNEFGKGRCVYISGLPYNAQNARVLYKGVLWASGKEDEINQWFSTNNDVDIHYYPKAKKYCLCNNSYQKQETTVHTDSGSYETMLAEGELRWERV
jgi:1,3-beta-galactosyl-N-acetylhexosamine phosphorylase